LIQKTEEDNSTKQEVFPTKPYNTLQEGEIRGDHTYFVGERVNHAVSDEEAAEDWVFHPRNDGLTEAERFRKRFIECIQEIKDYCDKNCGGFRNCKGYEECPMDLDTEHQLLHDDPKKVA